MICAMSNTLIYFRNMNVVDIPRWCAVSRRVINGVERCQMDQSFHRAPVLFFI